MKSAPVASMSTSRFDRDGGGVTVKTGSGTEPWSAKSWSARLAQLGVPKLYDHIEGWHHVMDLTADAHKHCTWDGFAVAFAMNCEFDVTFYQQLR
jgi:hypothetical protein